MTLNDLFKHGLLQKVSVDSQENYTSIDYVPKESHIIKTNSRYDGGMIEISRVCFIVDGEGAFWLFEPADGSDNFSNRYPTEPGDIMFDVYKVEKVVV